jgi:general secretion pathway protein G
MTRRGFTLIEILIVISIIAILAATVIPNFVGFDAEARLSATKSNLESIRTRVNLFRAKESRYPRSLGELLTVEYYDVGVKKPYLKQMPPELISDKTGIGDYVDQRSNEAISGSGGWVYFTDTADVKVNNKEPLGSKWGEFAEQIPYDW